AGIGTAYTGPGAVAIGTAASVGTEAAVGAAQDAIVRKSLGLDVDAGEIARRRSIQALFNTGGEIGSVVAGKGLSKLFAKEAQDEITSTIMKFSGESGVPMPNVVRSGEVEKLAEMGSKFPNSTSARIGSQIREIAAHKMAGEFDKFPDAPYMQILKEGAETQNQQLTKYHKKVVNDLNLLSAERQNVAKFQTEVKNRAKLQSEAQKKEFIENAQLELNRAAKNVSTKKPVNIEKVGLEFQSKLATNYIDKEIKSDALWKQAYLGMSDFNTNGARIGKIFNKVQGDAIRNLEGEVVRVLSPQSANMASTATKSLGDMAEEQISFEQLNNLIQMVERKPKTDTGFSTLANELRAERSNLLNSASKKAKEDFKAANDYFQTDILKFRNSDVGQALGLEKGEHWKQFKEARLKGNKGKLPKLYNGGSEVINKALSSPSSARRFIEGSGNDFRGKQILRDAWLAKKGLEPGKPISFGQLKLSKDDESMVSALWPKTEAGGLNRKLETLRRVARISPNKDYIDGITAETYNRIMEEGTDQAQRKLEQIAKKETVEKAKLDNYKSNKLVKLMAEGKIPLPDNKTTMKTFGKALLGAKEKELKMIMERMGNANPAILGSMQSSVLDHLISISGGASKTAREAGIDTIINPQQMRKHLIKNEANLKVLLGSDEAFKRIQRYNDVLYEFSMDEAVRPKGRVGTVGRLGQGSKMNFFLSDIYGGIKDRVANAMLTVAMKSPVPLQKFVTPEKHQAIQGGLVKLLFATEKGMSNLVQDADA
ncbi:MAG: hypothetical protein KJO69_11430, partial [Gammaproteobacteria bacterium]|nr:hypothetical protein [Gammaproteobacteria bacterium]